MEKNERLMLSYRLKISIQNYKFNYQSFCNMITSNVISVLA